MNLADEIRAQIEKNKGLKLAVGEINNHLSVLEELVRKDITERVDEAYKKGLHDGESKCRYCNEYQRGLDDAWDAAGKLVFSKDNGGLGVYNLLKIFGSESVNYALKKYSAPEAIAKIKAYEEKQKAEDEIRAGDEVIYNGTTKCIVVRPEDDERYASLIDSDGTLYSADHRECKKTGRHFDIDKILEEMRNEE